MHLVDQFVEVPVEFFYISVAHGLNRVDGIVGICTLN